MIIVLITAGIMAVLGLIIFIIGLRIDDEDVARLGFFLLAMGIVVVLLTVIPAIVIK